MRDKKTSLIDKLVFIKVNTQSNLDYCTNSSSLNLSANNGLDK